MSPSLTEKIDELVRYFMEKITLKSVLDKTHFAISFPKIVLNDVIDQKPSCSEDLGFAVNYEIKLLKSKETVTNNQLVRFKTQVGDLLAKICTRLIEKV